VPRGACGRDRIEEPKQRLRQDLRGYFGFRGAGLRRGSSSPRPSFWSESPTPRTGRPWPASPGFGASTRSPTSSPCTGYARRLARRSGSERALLGLRSCPRQENRIERPRSAEEPDPPGPHEGIRRVIFLAMANRPTTDPMDLRRRAGLVRMSRAQNTPLEHLYSGKRIDAKPASSSALSFFERSATLAPTPTGRLPS
jgi:hypothetical protein